MNWLRGNMDARALTGASILNELGDALDDLHAAVDAPLMARRPWLQAWIASHPHHRPLAVVVRDSGQLAAAALLAERDHGIGNLVALGHGPSDAAALPTRDDDAARALAAAIRDHLSERRRPWRLTIRHLPAGDPVAAPLAGLLPHAVLRPGAVSPVLRIGQERTLRAYVTRNHHQQVRRLRNRLRRDGLDPVISQIREPEDILGVLPDVMEVYRARDLDVGRRSAIDDPAAGGFFRRVVETHAWLRLVALTTLRLDGQLAAYVLCFVDGTAFRMWNCRFDPRWSRYGVGRLAHDAALEHALASGCELYDWGRGEEAYKSSISNDRIRADDLYAWSGRLVAAPSQVLLGAKMLAEWGQRRGGAAEHAVSSARRVLDRVRGP